MATDSFFALACGGLIAMLFGLVLAFAGYRLFLVLLPIWGFFFGLALGAQTMQAIFGEAFLATVTSWVVGFVVGAVFAVLAYLFYIVAVAIIAGSLGYSLAVGLLMWIGMSMGPLVWIVGIIVGVALAAVTIMFNLQKWVIIAATAIMGAGAVIGAFVLMFNPHLQALETPIQTAIKTSPLLAILFLVVAILGIVAQVRANRTFELETYSRW
jgi:hypothetical protein